MANEKFEMIGYFLVTYISAMIAIIALITPDYLVLSIAIVAIVGAQLGTKGKWYGYLFGLFAFILGCISYFFIESEDFLFQMYLTSNILIGSIISLIFCDKSSGLSSSKIGKNSQSYSTFNSSSKKSTPNYKPNNFENLEDVDDDFDW